MRPASTPKTPETRPDLSAPSHAGLDDSTSACADGALERCVGDIEVFESRHWGRTPLLRRARPFSTGVVDVFDDVLTSSTLDAFLATGIRRPIVRAVRDGTPVPPDRYTRRTRVGGVDIDDVIAPDRIAELFAEGCTVVAQSLHRTHPDVRTFTTRLGEEISHRVQANAYLTPPGATGLAPHSDGHDVIVLQLEGTKRWSIESLGDIELGAGDTLYIPAGHRHSAASADQVSFHLTVGILRTTYRSVLERVLRSGPAVLDDPLPLRFRTSESDLTRELGEVRDAVREHLAALDLDDLAESERARRSRPTPGPGALTAAIALLELDLGSRVVRSTAPWSMTRTGDSSIRLEVDGTWLTAPSSCADAVEQLGGGDAVRVGDLDGLDEASRVILARRLVTAGFCRVIDDTGVDDG